jgi:hypothetical protein
LDKLAEHLLEKEVIYKEDLEIIFGKRVFEDEILLDEKTSRKPVISTNGDTHLEPNIPGESPALEK